MSSLLTSLRSLDSYTHPRPPLQLKRKSLSWMILKPIIIITLLQMMTKLPIPLGMIETTTQTSGAPLGQMQGHFGIF